jgi:hypothetical protein
MRVDTIGRALRSDDSVVKGLYAVGTDAASIFRGPGTMIGPAMVFAWRAAMQAAGHLDQYPIPGDRAD